MKRSLTQLPKQRASVLSLSAAFACAICLSGCAGVEGIAKGFDTSWASGGTAEEDVLARLARANPEAPPAVAVGVTGRGLVGRTLPDGKRWEYTGAVDTLPILSGGVVAVSGSGRVALLDVKTGEVIWNDVPSGGRRLKAMAYDGSRTFLILADPDDSRPDKLLIVPGSKQRPAKHAPDDIKDGTTEASLGRPAALPGLALVPWDAEYVTALDLETGEPLGALPVTNDATAVQYDQEGFTLLGRGIVPFDERLLAERPPKPLALPKRRLPGNPAWPGDGTLTREPVPTSIAVLAKPVRKGKKLRFAGGAFATTYHRIVLGFGASKGDLRWATYFLRDIIAGDASDAGATLCLDDGSIWRLSWKDGARAPSGHLDARLRACVVEADPRPVTATVAEPLADQVSKTLINTGPDMAPVYGPLLDELSKSSSAEVTGMLLEIAQSPNASADLADQAAKRIARRTRGSDQLIAALEEQEDDSAKRPPPLTAIATALTRMNAKKGAVALAKHLLDPRASVADQLAIANALLKLADAEEAKPLRDYFSLYRGAAAEADLAQAVLVVAETLWRIDDQEGRDLVTSAARDPMTHPVVRSGLEQLLSRVDPPVASAAPAAPPPATPQRPPAGTAPKPPSQVAPPKP